MVIGREFDGSMPLLPPSALIADLHIFSIRPAEDSRRPMVAAQAVAEALGESGTGASQHVFRLFDLVRKGGTLVIIRNAIADVFHLANR
jgi:hypothetical protein